MKKMEERKIFKNIILFIVMLAAIIFVLLCYWQIDKLRLEKQARETKTHKQSESYNNYGLLGDAVISNTIVSEIGNYVIFSDHLVEKFTINENAANNTMLRAEALSNAAGGVKVALIPVPKRIMYEEETFGSREIYANFIATLESLNTSGNISIVNTDTELFESDGFDFYRTQDGWTMDGAYFGYKGAMSAFGQEAYPIDYFTAYQYENFGGDIRSEAGHDAAATEEIKDLLDDMLHDPFIYRYADDFKNYEQVYDNSLNMLIKKPVIPKAATSVVGSGIDYAIVEGSGSGNMIIVGDSRAKMMVPYFCANYEKVIYVSIQECESETLSQILATYPAEGVVMVQTVERMGLASYSKAVNGFVTE